MQSSTGSSRGDNFYQDGGQKGPDLELTINGEKTYVDVSGIADSAMAHKSKFHAAKITVNQTKTQLVRSVQTSSVTFLNRCLSSFFH